MTAEAYSYSDDEYYSLQAPLLAAGDTHLKAACDAHLLEQGLVLHRFRNVLRLRYRLAIAGFINDLVIRHNTHLELSGVPPAPLLSESLVGYHIDELNTLHANNAETNGFVRRQLGLAANHADVYPQIGVACRLHTAYNDQPGRADCVSDVITAYGMSIGSAELYSTMYGVSFKR